MKLGRERRKTLINWNDNMGQRSSFEVKGQERIAKNDIFSYFSRLKWPRAIKFE